MMFNIIILSAITIIKQDGMFGMVQGNNNNTITTTTVVYTLHGGEIFAITVTVSSLCNFPFLYIFPTTGRYNKPGKAQTALKLSHSFLFSCFLMFIYMQLVFLLRSSSSCTTFFIATSFPKARELLLLCVGFILLWAAASILSSIKSIILLFQNLSFCGCRIQIQ